MGKGSFQECDQVAAVLKFTKFAASAQTLDDIPRLIACAFQASVDGRPGSSYVGFPSDVLLSRLPSSVRGADFARSKVSLACMMSVDRVMPAQENVAAAAALLASSSRPLIVIGKGASWSGVSAQRLVNLGIPFLGTNMGR